MKRPTIIHIDHRDQKCSGEYAVQGRTLTVGGAYGSISVPLKVKDNPGAVAPEVLRDLVDIWRSTR